MPIDLFNVGRVARKLSVVKKALSAKLNEVKLNKIRYDHIYLNFFAFYIFFSFRRVMICTLSVFAIFFLTTLCLSSFLFHFDISSSLSSFLNPYLFFLLIPTSSPL